MKPEYFRIYLNQRVLIKEYPDFDVPVDFQTQLIHYLQTIPNKYYVQLFLKQFINSNEAKGNEILEDLYEMYCDPDIMLAKPPTPTQADNITYHINDRDLVIRETPNVIGGLGTTGMRTWEAALHLSSYLGVGEIKFDGSTVCELGTGTGLVGMSLLPKAQKVIFTDGDTNLLESLQLNLDLNQFNQANNYNYDIKQLVWGAEDSESLTYPKVDYVVAADVTYDTSVLPDLVYTINEFLVNGCNACIIAATVRNENTLGEFERLLSEKNLQWSVINHKLPFGICETSNSVIWYKSGTPPINIYNITSK